MAWRPVAHTVQPWILARRITVAVAVGLMATVSSMAEGAEPEGVNIRVATYHGEEGAKETHFAASIQPSPEKSLLAAVTQADADVAIVVDTSASQSGAFREDSLKALQGILSQLRKGDRARVYAADVRAADLSAAFHSAQASATSAAVAKLKQRLPLGNTNLVATLDAVRAGLVSEPTGRTRSVVYIGDGAAIDAAHDRNRLANLVDALRADRISVHSIAVGPTANVELMGVLANQTGGMVGSVGTDRSHSAEAIARQVAQATSFSPIWLNDVSLPEGMKLVHGNRLPPLRLDRDSILLGTMPAGTEQAQFVLQGQTSGAQVKLTAKGEVEPSHPDFAFLPGLIRDASSDHGLRLPSAGSVLLRETARLVTARADELVRAGKLALGQGNRRGAQAIAELAMESDPTNQDAVAIRNVAIGDRLVAQNPGDDLDDVFGQAGAEGAEVDPFAEPQQEPAADRAPAPVPEPADEAPAPPRAQAGPQERAVPQQRGDFGPAGDDDLLETGGELLDRIRAQRTASEGRLRAEVRAQLNEAARLMRVDPTGVAGQLKALLARVEAAPDVSPQLRQELTSQVRSAIQVASRREAEYAENQATLQERASGAAASQRLLQETYRREAKLESLSEQLNALIDEGRYEEADGQVSLEFARIAGDTITRDSVAGRHFTDMPLSLQTYARDRRFREMRERNFVDVFSLVLKANIPFVGEPPIVYPEADVWQRLSRRRIERYGAAIELVGDNEGERRIERELANEVSFNFPELPLEDAVRQIQDDRGIPIVIDRRALEELGLTTDIPVNLSLENVTLRSFLRLMLRELDLTYMIKDEVLQITSLDAAEENLVNKVYPVGDLVVPIIQLGGMGGMGGGMMGGGMGGMGGMGGGMMGGGMGGMGGGMMGGGMGGMGGGMGGMGGGMFAVPDEVALRDKTSSRPAASSASASSSAPVATPSGDSTAPQAASAEGSPAISFNRETSSKDRVQPSAVATGAAPIRLTASPGESLDDAWASYFADREISSPEELAELDRQVRATVREWNVRSVAAHKAGDEARAVECFDHIRAVIAAAMQSGHVQPWMYQAYALALQATGAPSEEVERALLSAVDFAQTPEDILHVAARLEEIGSDAAAFELCRNVSAVDPYRREPYVMGLRIAKRIGESEAIAWACQGVLSQAWPESFQPVVEEAQLIARATYQELVEQERLEEAAAFGQSLERAAAHDALVRVTWTGDADIDLLVEEPSGTICSHENRTTAGGGTLLADAFPGQGEDETGAVSEVYLCPQGFSGQYRALLRRVWGNVSTGHATIEVLTDVGRPSQRYIRKQIPLTEKDAMVVFEVNEGRRQQEVAEAQLAHLRDVQRDVQHNLLGQIAAGNDEEVLSDFLQDMFMLSRAQGNGALANNPFFRRGAVGFRPELTVLPTGANLMALAIVSADRRYVRISPAPMFSQVGDVNTFNFVTGDEGGGQGGGGAGGIGGGGLGGIGGGGGGFGGGGGGIF